MSKERYQEYLETEHWQKVRKRFTKRAGYKCQLCGNTGRLNVHHNNYDCLGKEKVADVIVLCKSCHFKFHNILPVILQTRENVSEKASGEKLMNKPTVKDKLLKRKDKVITALLEQEKSDGDIEIIRKTLIEKFQIDKELEKYS